MEVFIERGLSWVASTIYIDFIREIKLGDKIAAGRYSVYTLVATSNGRPTRIPEDIIQKYTI